MDAERDITSAVKANTAEISTSGVLPYLDRLIFGDSVKLMRNLPDGCVDLIVTDPPYVANYCDRGGRRILNDNNTRWIYPAFFEAHTCTSNSGMTTVRTSMAFSGSPGAVSAATETP
jgi:hypothetical protein